MLSSSWIRASWAPAEAGGGRRPGAGAKDRAPARGSGVWVRHGVYSKTSSLRNQPLETQR